MLKRGVQEGRVLYWSREWAGERTPMWVCAFGGCGWWVGHSIRTTAFVIVRIRGADVCVVFGAVVGEAVGEDDEVAFGCDLCQ